ncbi:TBC domain protein [Spraguea lophii 42_110]|uniref:TBC domain protein n=1 Tax=Spraguea lophii (strain 42_110) TaxID=1358809 RepID=S7XPZ0_SPRLO|nr:TBC domain protein [Spraguea lophii 42_110]
MDNLNICNNARDNTIVKNTNMNIHPEETCNVKDNDYDKNEENNKIFKNNKDSSIIDNNVIDSIKNVEIDTEIKNTEMLDCRDSKNTISITKNNIFEKVNEIMPSYKDKRNIKKYSKDDILKYNLIKNDDIKTETLIKNETIHHNIKINDLPSLEKIMDNEEIEDSVTDKNKDDFEDNKTDEDVNSDFYKEEYILNEPEEEKNSNCNSNENIISKSKYRKGGGRVYGDIYGFYGSKNYAYPTNFSKMVEKWYGFINGDKRKEKSIFRICKAGCFKEKDFNLEKRVLEGVPLFLKYRVWKKLLNRNYVAERENVDFKDLKEKYCGYEYQIDVDIQRTLREHSLYFEEYGDGQCDLFNVLVAFANYEPRIGYCQGMSNFAGIILMYFNEEESFDMLKKIIYKNNLVELFDHCLSKLNGILNVQKKLMCIFTPQIVAHLERNGISLSSFMCSWYLTLFSRFDVEYVLRFYDLFFFYGFSILLVIACAILKYHESRILEYQSEGLMEYLNNLENEEMNLKSIIKNIKMYLDLVKIKEIEKMIEKVDPNKKI